MGLPVPRFVAVPADHLAAIVGSHSSEEISPALLQLAAQIVEKLDCRLYAVRSSALVEDQRISSFAGRFHSETAVPREEIPRALSLVIREARRVLGDAPGLSLLIQEYIDAELSGVAFTRDPGGGRELVIEFVEGPCEALVSGAVTPRQVRGFHGQRLSAEQERFESVIEDFLRVEADFGFPQDIEWCFSRGSWWFLQSRPISTLSDAQFRGMRRLDEYFAGAKPKVLERTGVCEVSPRPSPATFSLLRRLYAEGGPVSAVYRKYRIAYHSRDFLERVEGELFSNRELEFQTLFPAYSLGANGEMRLASFAPRSVFQTFQNKMRLQLISGADTEFLTKKLHSLLLSERFESAGTLEAELFAFLADYEIVFEINFLAGALKSKLETLLNRLFPGDTSLLTSLVSAAPFSLPEFQIPTARLVGNSLEFLDESEFTTAARSTELAPGVEVPERVRSLPEWKREPLLKLASSVSMLVQLRETGRWLAILHINRLRKTCLQLGAEHGLRDPRDVFRFSLDHILSDGNVHDLAPIEVEVGCFAFPSVIGSVLTPVSTEAQTGIAPGSAIGRLLREGELGGVPDGESCILFTEILTPRHAEHLEKIAGVVSLRGGLLSHFAILARERGVPVVAGVSSDLIRELLGTVVVIDGTTGSVRLASDRKSE